MSLDTVPARLELKALVARRDELDREHEQAVAKLEAEGPDRSARNRRECGRVYDERASVQKQIDDLLAKERSR